MGTVATFRVNPISESAPSDQELIARTLGGDGAAFGILVERFQRKIYRVAYAIVRDEIEADTITQDTFIQAYTHLAKFQGRSELETWLTRIAINRSRDWLRRRKFVSLFIARRRRATTAATYRAGRRAARCRSARFMSHQLRAAIRRAERKLSSQQKIIFRLRHYENHSLEEIAELLGLRSGTVRAHLFRAIHKVRKELARVGDEETRESDDEAL